MCNHLCLLESEPALSGFAISCVYMISNEASVGSARAPSHTTLQLDAHLGAVYAGCDLRAAIITKPQRTLRWSDAPFLMWRGESERLNED